MRLSKAEWIAVAFAVAMIVVFGSWLQGEMNRAARLRAQRETMEPRGGCAGMSAEDTRRIGQGALWCGAVGVD